MADPKDPDDVEEAPRTLREIAEESYDDVLDATEETEEEPSEQEGRPRDALGRFTRSESGEAEDEEPPSPDDDEPPPATEQPHPAPETGVAAQAPENWNAEIRAKFEKLSEPWEKEFLLQRAHELESDYQRKVQATAFSNQFTQAITPVFNDPDIAAALRRDGRSPVEAIYQWANIQKRAELPELEDRITLLFDLAKRMQIDPAAVFGLSPAPVGGLSKEDLANPAVKKLADQLGQVTSRLQAQEAEHQQRKQAEEAAIVGSKRAEIDAFADQRMPDGSLAHPYFDHFLPVIMEHYKANPSLSIEQSYKAVIVPILNDLRTQTQTAVSQQNNVQRAQGAVRSNVRGMTAPVSRPAPNGAKRSLRDVIEESADEVGL